MAVEPAAAGGAAHLRPRKTSAVFEVDHVALMNAVRLVRWALPSSSRGVVALQACGDSVEVRAASRAASIQVSVPCSSRPVGRLIVEHAEMSELLSAVDPGRTPGVPGVPVRIDTTADGTSMLRAAGCVVPLSKVNEPTYTEVASDRSVTACVDRQELLTGWNRVLGAVRADTSDAREFARGVNIEVAGDAVRLAGTDGCRLAVTHLGATRPAPSPAADKVHATVPGHLTGEILAALKGDRIALALPATPSGSVELTAGNVKATVSALDCSFPNLRRYHLLEPTGKVVVDRAALTAAAARAAAIARAKAVHPARVAITVAVDELLVAPWLGAATSCKMPGVPARVSGVRTGFRLLFDPRFLIDALDSFSEDVVAIHPTVQEALLFTAEGVGGNFRHLLMPVRLPDTR